MLTDLGVKYVIIAHSERIIKRFHQALTCLRILFNLFKKHFCLLFPWKNCCHKNTLPFLNLAIFYYKEYF